MKKDPTMKKEEESILQPVLPSQPKKTWWQLELELQAAARGADDQEDTAGKHLLMQRSSNEDVLATSDRQAE
jgi:hypothetical protein